MPAGLLLAGCTVFGAVFNGGFDPFLAESPAVERRVAFGTEFAWGEAADARGYDAVGLLPWARADLVPAEGVECSVLVSGMLGAGGELGTRYDGGDCYFWTKVAFERSALRFGAKVPSADDGVNFGTDEADLHLQFLFERSDGAVLLRGYLGAAVLGHSSFDPGSLGTGQDDVFACGGLACVSNGRGWAGVELDWTANPSVDEYTPIARLHAGLGSGPWRVSFQLGYAGGREPGWSAGMAVGRKCSRSR